MQGNSSVRTAGFAAGFGVLLFVLILVVCITTGVLPLRESYAQDPGPGQLPPALTATPTPTPGNTAPEVTPTPTPTPTPEATPEPTETPVETPAPTPGTLEEEKPTFTITVTFSKGGTAIPYGMSAVVENGSIEIVAVPNEGYAVESFVLDGKDLGPLTSYTLENVTENHSIYIAFTRAIFAPTVTPNPGTAMGEADQPE